jgi:hypothetical protein
LNFIAHIAVGVRSQIGARDDLFLSGTALPDFASMAGVRLLPAEGQLAHGIALHHATDHVFHAGSWFLDLERDMRHSLARAGLSDGGARVCAHVGPELLLDGTLLSAGDITAAVATVFDAIAAPDPVLLDTVSDHERSGWADHLARIAASLDPYVYVDVAAVGRLLWRIAGRRPRLAFGAQHIPAVVTTLAGVRTRIEPVAHEVVADVAARTL